VSRIIAFDPGEQTGWAYADLSSEGLANVQFGYDAWKVVAMQFLQAQLGERPFDIVVYESWRLRAANAMALVGSDLPSSQCVGAIKMAAWHSNTFICTSEPSNKPVIDSFMGGTDYLPARDQVEHYRDALRHLYWYAAFKEKVPRDKL
jgi:hypothetical protein